MMRRSSVKKEKTKKRDEAEREKNQRDEMLSIDM